jgi:hypothetical protein
VLMVFLQSGLLGPFPRSVFLCWEPLRWVNVLRRGAMDSLREPDIVAANSLPAPATPFGAKPGSPTTPAIEDNAA